MHFAIYTFSFGGFRNMGREKSQIVCIYTNIEDRSSVSSSDPRGGGGGRLSNSQFAHDDSRGDNRSARSSNTANDGSGTFYSRRNSGSGMIDWLFWLLIEPLMIVFLARGSLVGTLSHTLAKLTRYIYIYIYCEFSVTIIMIKKCKI